jgi:hypothetical protein
METRMPPAASSFFALLRVVAFADELGDHVHDGRHRRVIPVKPGRATLKTLT